MVLIRDAVFNDSEEYWRKNSHIESLKNLETLIGKTEQQTINGGGFQWVV